MKKSMQKECAVANPPGTPSPILSRKTKDLAAWDNADPYKKVLSPSDPIKQRTPYSALSSQQNQEIVSPPCLCSLCQIEPDLLDTFAKFISGVNRRG